MWETAGRSAAGPGQGLFKLPVDEAGALLRAAKDVLDSWYAAYMQARPPSFSPPPHPAQPACTDRIAVGTLLRAGREAGAQTRAGPQHARAGRPTCMRACHTRSKHNRLGPGQRSGLYLDLARCQPCTAAQRVPAQVRESIEASGRDARWEFSRAGLFERTQHMAEACACLAGMVETTAGLYQFMGPQLKAVTGDPQARGHGERILFDNRKCDTVSVLLSALPGVYETVCKPCCLACSSMCVDPADASARCMMRTGGCQLPRACLHAQTLFAQTRRGAWVHASHPPSHPVHACKGEACARQCIDAVLTRVDGMVALVEGLGFSPLEPAHAGRWAAVRARFNSAGEEVKLATRDLINTCFRRAGPLAPALRAALQHSHCLAVIAAVLVIWSAAEECTAFWLSKWCDIRTLRRRRLASSCAMRCTPCVARADVGVLVRELRSAEAALELLGSFKHLRTRGMNQQQIASKSLDILQQFGREIDAITAVFNLHKVHLLHQRTMHMFLVLQQISFTLIDILRR